MTRAELEEICSDLLERVSAPIGQALEAADMTMVRSYVYNEGRVRKLNIFKEGLYM